MFNSSVLGVDFLNQLFKNTVLLLCLLRITDEGLLQINVQFSSVVSLWLIGNTREKWRFLKGKREKGCLSHRGKDSAEGLTETTHS